LERTGEIGAFQGSGESENSLSIRPPLKQALDGPAGKVVEFAPRITVTGLELEETAV